MLSRVALDPLHQLSLAVVRCDESLGDWHQQQSNEDILDPIRELQESSEGITLDVPSEESQSDDEVSEDKHPKYTHYPD